MYLQSLVVIRERTLQGDKYRYAVMGGFDGMNWFLAGKAGMPSVSIVNSIVIPRIKAIEDNYTTLAKIDTAPVDTVLLLEGDGYEDITGKNRIDLRDKPDFNLIEHLKP